MKKILNNIGAVSKQVIVGSVITVATVVVGIGLVNNFSSKGDSQSGFASNAMERSNPYNENVYTGPSAEDILSARDYAQDSKEGLVSSITGTENMALNRKNSTQNTTVSQPGQEQESAGVVDGTTAYGAGELEGMGISNKVEVNISSQEADAQAQRQAKIAKGQELGNQARATLKTSKMADGSGNIKGMDNISGSTSMVYGGIGNNQKQGTAGTSDSSKITLAQAGKLSNVNLQSNNTGKLGAMGTKSVAAEGQRQGRSAAGVHSESLGDLGVASKYSREGKKAVVSDAAKGAADAAAAFDGSKEAEAVNLEGGNLQQAALNALQDMGGPDMKDDLNKIKDDLDKIDETMNTWSDLLDKITDCVMAMVLAASIASIAVGIFSKIEPWGAAAALAAAAVGTAAILGAQIAASVFLSQISDLALSSGIDSIKPSAWDWAMPWVVGGVLAGLVWLAWGLAGVSTSEAAAVAGEAVGEGGSQAASQGANAVGMASKGVSSLGGSGASSAVQHFFKKIGKKK